MGAETATQPIRATTRATAIGTIAIGLWGLLALFTVLSSPIPPLQLTAMSFAIGACVGFAPLVWNPGRLKHFRQPAAVWLLGIAGLFGYHFLYFSALQNAPPVEAGLIAYLWPLFIVLGSSLLPGAQMRWFHLAGAFFGLLGCILIITKGESLALRAEYIVGYALALACALTWSSYSLLSRRFKTVPTDVVAGFCLATAVLAGGAHILLEETLWPLDTVQWIAILGLGLGPVGLAFYTWDYGVKHGGIQLLGVFSYATPLISTLVLLAAGFGNIHWSVFAAAIAISGGALLASQNALRRRS